MITRTRIQYVFSSHRRTGANAEISFWVKKIAARLLQFSKESDTRERKRGEGREETPPADCQTLRIKGTSRWLPLSLSLPLPLRVSRRRDAERPTPLASYGSLKKIDLNHGQDNKSALLRGNAGEKNEGRSDTKGRRGRDEGRRYRRGVVYKGYR